MTAAFGEIAAGGAEGEAAGESIAGDEGDQSIDLGHGHKMDISGEQLRQILHSDEVVAAIRQRAQGVCDDCNSMKVKKRAVYEVLVQNTDTSTRARAFVRPANADAFYDDAVHSTMLKASANAPSDPKMEPERGDEPDNGPEPGDAEEGEAGEDAEAGEEAAELSEIADVAVLAI